MALAGQHLGRLDVGLVEGIDAQAMAGHRRRHLPQEELLPQVVQVPQAQAHHRMPGILEGLHSLVVGIVAVQPQVDEQPVVAIDIRRAQRLADHGQDALALLAGALGDELLHPITKVAKPRRGDKGHLVPASLGQLTQDRAQPGAVVVAIHRAVARLTVAGHGQRLLQQRLYVHSHQRRRHQPKVGQRPSSARRCWDR